MQLTSIQECSGENINLLGCGLSEKFNHSSLQFGLIENTVAGTKKMLDPTSVHMPAVKLLELIWKEVSSLNDERIGEHPRVPSRLLFTAAELGNSGFLTVLIHLNPDFCGKSMTGSKAYFMLQLRIVTRRSLG